MPIDMSNTTRTILFAATSAIALVLMVLWMAGSFEDKIKPGQESDRAVYSGEIYTVDSSKVEQFEEVAGTLQSLQSSDISAQIMARVRKINVHAGDTVKHGDVLIELDNVDLRSRVNQAKENLKSLQAQFQQSKSHYQRTTRLFEKNSATQATLEQATSAYHSLRSQVSAARESLAEAENALGYSQIKATFSGRVIDHFVENGDMASPGMRLLTVYDPHALQVLAYIRESQALTLTMGQQLQARVDALQKTVSVTVAEMVSASEPGSRSFLIKSRIEYDARLLPGMFVRLRIPLGNEPQILIPGHYVKRVGQLDVVWVVKEGHIERRFVRTDDTLGQNNLIRIITGLQEGEQLVVPQDTVDNRQD
jgi:RND family efflux transporter MFP subunit